MGMSEKLPTLRDAEQFWRWRETVEKAQQACGLRDRSAIAISYMLLSPTLQGRLNTSTPFQETWMVLPRPIFYDWLREAIQAPDCQTYAKEALARCRQEDGEELTRFAQRVVTLMTRCNMATKGNKGATIQEPRNRQVFMEHLRRGVRTEVAKSILRHAGSVGISVQDYLERLHEDQVTIKQMDNLSSAPTSGLGLPAPEPMEVDQIAQEGKKTKRFSGKCFRCNKQGHMKKDCKVKLPTTQKEKTEAVSALLEDCRQQNGNEAVRIQTVKDSSRAERESMYRSMVPGDSELGMKLLDGPASSTRWMEVPEDPPFQCSMMGAVERLDQGRCIMSITINVLIDSGQNVLEGVVVSENFIQLLGLTDKDLIKKGVRNISTADPKGPGLKVIGRVKRGLIGMRFCEHESVFVQPLVVQGLANEVNVGLVFMSAVNARLNFAARSVEFGKHCTRPLARQHTEGYRLTREPGRSEFSYQANQGINSILFSKTPRPGLRMQRTGDRWEAVLEGDVKQGDGERLAVDSGPLPEDLVGNVFIPYRPDVAPTRVGMRGLVLMVPTRDWRDGEVVGRLERGPESKCVKECEECESDSR